MDVGELGGQRPGGARVGVLLDELAAGEVAAARLLARRTEILVELAARGRCGQLPGGVVSFLELELAGTCRLGQGAVAGRLADAERLTDALPRTLALLGGGELFCHQASVLLTETAPCTALVARAVEQRVLPAGVELCPPDLRKKVRKAVLTAEAEQDGVAQQDREAAARAGRRTWARQDRDGMGVAGAWLPVERLRAWQLGLDALAGQERTADLAAGVTRTADQRRADLFAALPAMVLAWRAGDLGGAAPGASGRAPQVIVNVHVPMSTVLELDDTAGQLDGAGPVSAAHVRYLLPTAALRRVAVDERTGRPLHLDPSVIPATGRPRTAQQVRDTVLAMLRPAMAIDCGEPAHDPSAALGRLVDLRDIRCSGPGCSMPAGRVDRDHRTPWPDGPTAAWNLHLLSRRCHLAKHQGWSVTTHSDGSASWTSPLRRSYHRPAPHDPPPTLPEGVDLRPPRQHQPSEPATEIDDDDSDDDNNDAPAATATEPQALTRPEADDDPPPF